MMNNPRIVLKRNDINLYDLEIKSPVTILYDLSGTGKTALANFCDLSERSDVEVISDNAIIVNPRSYIDVTTVEANTIFIIDEVAIQKVLPVAHHKHCYIIFMGRDFNSVQIKDRIAYGRLCMVDGCIHLNYYANNEIRCSSKDFELKEVICEDTGSGMSFYKMLIPEHISVNGNIEGTMGYYNLVNVLSSSEHSGLLVIADGSTYHKIHQALYEYTRVFEGDSHVYAFNCFEELLLNLDVFDTVPQVQGYLKSGRVPTGYKGTAENYAYDLLSSAPVSPCFVHNKSGDNIDCRIFTKTNRSRIALLLPSVLQGYFVVLNPSTNKYVVRSILWNIVNNPKYEVLKDGRYQQEIRAYLRTNTTIVTVDELISDVIAKRVIKDRDGKSYFYNSESCLLVCKGQAGKDNFIKCNAEVMDLLSLITIQYST